MNLSVYGQSGLEIQADAEFFERNGHSSKPLPWLNYGERKFPPCQEARLFVCFGQQVWLRQNLQQIFLLQSLDNSSQVNIGTKEEDVQHIANGLLGGELRVPDRKVIIDFLCSEAAKLPRRGCADGLSRPRGKEIDA